jgi:hypothetical protein
VIQEPVIGVSPRAAARLNDDGRLGLARRFHDRLNLFQVVDVECANTVTAFGSLVENLPHCN